VNFDGLLVSQPATGRALLATGLILAVVISEGLLIGLGIRLPMLYRIPYHLFLVLLFLYPLAIVIGLGDDTGAAVWRVYLFSPAAGLVLLTLLPAIRRGPGYVAENGTPWRWPLFPWALFGFLTICVSLRSYALSLSFDTVLMQNLDAAMRLDSAFGPYFLVPILLAIALLFLEGGIVTHNRTIQTLALALPFVCVALSRTPPAGSAPYDSFLQQFIDRVGSPMWIASLASLIFLAFAYVRQVRMAGAAFWGALLIAACVDRRTIDLTNTASLQTWAFWFAAAVQGFVGLRNRQSWRLFAATVCGLIAARLDLLGGANSLYKDLLPLHLAGIAVLGLGMFCHDAFAGWLRWVGMPLLVMAAIGATGITGEFPASVPAWVASVYGAAIVCISFAYAYAIRSPEYFLSGLANVVLLAGRLFYDLSGILKRLFHWEGAVWFVWGLAWFALGVLISSAKAGGIDRLLRLAPRRKNVTKV